jgi:hypothetical protein
MMVLVFLQAQQALLSVQWPEGLGMDEPVLPSADSISTRRTSSEYAGNPAAVMLPFLCYSSCSTPVTSSNPRCHVLKPPCTTAAARQAMSRAHKSDREGATTVKGRGCMLNMCCGCMVVLLAGLQQRLSQLLTSGTRRRAKHPNKSAGEAAAGLTLSAASAAQQSICIIATSVC